MLTSSILSRRMIVWRVCDRRDQGFAWVSVKKMKKPHEAPPLLVQSGGGGGGDDLAQEPHPNVPFALSTKRRRSSISRKLACLPAANTAPAAALNAIAANHHSHPLSTPPPQQQHQYHPPPRHPRNHPPRQQTTPRQVSVANGISCALTTNVLCRQSDAGPVR